MKGKCKNQKLVLNSKIRSLLLYGFVIFLVLLLMGIGVVFSYAFWVDTDQQTGQNEVVSGCLSFTFNDKNVDNKVTSIFLSNTYPMDDIKGMSETPYVFTITNTCTLKARVSIYLHTLSSSTLDSQYVKSYFNDSTSKFVTGPQLLTAFSASTLDLDTSNMIIDKVGTIDETYLLNTVDLQSDASVTYSLRLWIDYDAPNSIMGSTYNGAVSVMAVPISE